MTGAGTAGDCGSLRETYHAALQYDKIDRSGNERFVGVVRRPMRWFTQVDENVPALGPPDHLLDAFKEVHESLKMDGMCDEGAHNAAWEEMDFEARYREYLAESDEAQSEIDRLTGLVADGEDVVLVCYEGDDKRCHRHVLLDVLESRLE